jgi:predicted PurR-regulated permease PerM
MYRYLARFMALALFCFAVYNATQIIAPFFLSFLIAYFLHKKIDILESKFQINRTIICLFVVLTFCFVITLGLSILVPKLLEQSKIIIKEAPKYQIYIQSKLLPTITRELSKLDPEIATTFSDIVNSGLSMFMSRVMLIINHMVSYTIATFNFIMGIFIFPIILFYFLVDWHQIVRYVSSFVPNRYKKLVSNMSLEIDQLTSAYIIGQLYICLGVSLYYIIGFGIIGVPAPTLIGLICGFAIIVPLIGGALSFVSVVLITYFSFGSGSEIMCVIALFAIAHIVEGNIISPRVIGDKIGIHPIMMIFVVLLFGNLFGVVGALFAIPVSAILRVLTKYGLILQAQNSASAIRATSATNVARSRLSMTKITRNGNFSHSRSDMNKNYIQKGY